MKDAHHKLCWWSINFTLWELDKTHGGMIECKRPHLTPYNIKGISINGVLYYYAWIKNEGSLISFDLTSEEFNVIKLPEDIPWLVNYTGKITLRSQSNGKLDLWVLEDAKRQEWSKVSVCLGSFFDRFSWDSWIQIQGYTSIVSVAISRRTMAKKLWLKELLEITLLVSKSILMMFLKL